MKTIEITLCFNIYSLLAVLALCAAIIICVVVENRTGGKRKDGEIQE